MIHKILKAEPFIIFWRGSILKMSDEMEVAEMSVVDALKEGMIFDQNFVNIKRTFR